MGVILESESGCVSGFESGFESVRKWIFTCGFVVVFWVISGVLTKVVKKANILESEVESAWIMGLGAFRCDLEEGVRVF